MRPLDGRRQERERPSGHVQRVDSSDRGAPAGPGDSAASADSDAAAETGHRGCSSRLGYPAGYGPRRRPCRDRWRARRQASATPGTCSGRSNTHLSNCVRRAFPPDFDRVLHDHGDRHGGRGDPGRGSMARSSRPRGRRIPRGRRQALGGRGHPGGVAGFTVAFLVVNVAQRVYSYLNSKRSSSSRSRARLVSRSPRRCSRGFPGVARMRRPRLDLHLQAWMLVWQWGAG